MSILLINLESFGAKTQKSWPKNRSACKVWHKIVEVFLAITYHNLPKRVKVEDLTSHLTTTKTSVLSLSLLTKPNILLVCVYNYLHRHCNEHHQFCKNEIFSRNRHHSQQPIQNLKFILFLILNDFNANSLYMIMVQFWD